MDLRLFFTTFGVVFLAELGDKTQLATLGLAAESRSWLVVFLGSAAALIATSLIAALAGETVSRIVPPIYLRRAAGLLFIVLGVVSLVRSSG